jgi:LmbE family N-acetylglucosaminyl deacetylase
MSCVASLFMARAAAEPAPTAGALAHALDRVATTGRVLYIAAHPDDENTRLLAYLANVRHLDVGYLAMTRGGGGQNLIGGEQGALLDVIRTEELAAARRLDGARQFFTRMRDFGFSKRADETLATWGHDAALADVVRVIRTFQPDVIITRFDELPPNHGHHTASAILAREAFAAAADPARFADQLREGVRPWQADRLLYNVARAGNAPVPGSPPTPDDAIELDIGGYDPRLGLEIGELAALSRSQHKSQGFGVAAERGPLIEHFVGLAGHKPVHDPLDGLALGWQRYGAAAEATAQAIGVAQRALERDHPERAVPALLRARDELARLAAQPALRDDPRLRDARRALDDVVLAAAGVYARATAARPIAAPGTTVDVTIELVARAVPITVARVELPGAPPRTPGTALGAGHRDTIALAVALPAGAPPSVISWLRRPPAPGHYTLDDARQIGAPGQPAALTASVELAIAGHAIQLALPVVHAWTDPVHGERVRPFLVVPPATVTPVRDAVMVPGKTAAVELVVRAGRDGLAARVELAVPPGWTVSPASHDVALARLGDQLTLRFDVSPGAHAEAGDATPVVRIGDAAWSLREDTIDLPHIPLQLVLRPAAIRLVPLAIRIPAGRVGYVRGSGDSIAADLAHVGFVVDDLDDAALRTGNLERYATIILGIRAYNTRAAVRTAHPRLMAYVERGGTLIVQYNTLALDGPIGPFPLALGRGRITDETAAPRMLDPRDPLLTTPNRITAADFDGWVQERGIYFGATWDARYRPVLRFSDPGEAPLDGALLVAPHGKGRYIYTGLVLFRELPAGVPGAYRLFANLIAGGRGAGR